MDIMTETPQLVQVVQQHHGHGKLLLGLSLFATFASYELWAVKTRNLTLSQQFARSSDWVKGLVGGGIGLTVTASGKSQMPKWMKWAIVGTSAFVSYHLYVGMNR